MLLLGSREESTHLGYVTATCPKCRHRGPMVAFLGKRKVTFAALLAVPVNEQLVLECLACQARIAVPPDQESVVRERLVDHARLADMAEQALSRQAAVPAGPTAYQLLQVDPEADTEIIQAAFKRLAMRYHPDRSKDPDAEEHMRELVAAHDLLTDPARRERYDRSIGLVRRKPRPMPPAMRADDV